MACLLTPSRLGRVLRWWWLAAVGWPEDKRAASRPFPGAQCMSCSHSRAMSFLNRLTLKLSCHQVDQHPPALSTPQYRILHHSASVVRTYPNNALVPRFPGFPVQRRPTRIPHSPIQKAGGSTQPVIGRNSSSAPSQCRGRLKDVTSLAWPGFDWLSSPDSEISSSRPSNVAVFNPLRWIASCRRTKPKYSAQRSSSAPNRTDPIWCLAEAF